MLIMKMCFLKMNLHLFIPKARCIFPVLIETSSQANVGLTGISYFIFDYNIFFFKSQVKF